MTRIIDDFAVEETNDGYRIEIKGDKETIRSLLANLTEWPRWYRRRWLARGEGPDFHREKWIEALAMCGPWSADEAE
jgi:hypothetical protein